MNGAHRIAHTIKIVAEGSARRFAPPGAPASWTLASDPPLLASGITGIRFNLEGTAEKKVIGGQRDNAGTARPGAALGSRRPLYPRLKKSASTCRREPREFALGGALTDWFQAYDVLPDSPHPAAPSRSDCYDFRVSFTAGTVLGKGSYFRSLTAIRATLSRSP